MSAAEEVKRLLGGGEAARLERVVPRAVLHALASLEEHEEAIAFLTHNSPKNILDHADTQLERGAAILALLLEYPGVVE